MDTNGMREKAKKLVEDADEIDRERAVLARKRVRKNELNDLLQTTVIVFATLFIIFICISVLWRF
jgi:hypothetical protein